MAELQDTIRRVNSGEPMTLEELHRARAVLDAHSRGRKADVIGARRRVGALIDQLAPAQGVDDVDAEPVTAGSVAATPSSAGSRLAGGVVLVAAVALVGGCVAFLADRGGGGDEGGAIAYCHQFVEDLLKSPDSADFPSFPDHDVIETGTMQWRVSSYVDAENSFGASLRTDWTCEISYDESEGVWTLESMTGL